MSSIRNSAFRAIKWALTYCTALMIVGVSPSAAQAALSVRNLSNDSDGNNNGEVKIAIPFRDTWMNAGSVEWEVVGTNTWRLKDPRVTHINTGFVTTDVASKPYFYGIHAVTSLYVQITSFNEVTTTLSANTAVSLTCPTDAN